MDDEEKEKGQEKTLSLETFRSNLEATLELVAEGFLDPGTPIGLGGLCEAPSMDMAFAQIDDVDGWVRASKKEKEDFLRNVLFELDLSPEYLTSERAKRTFNEEGVPGQPSQDGAVVLVFGTKYPQFELHLKLYRNELIGNHYDLVVTRE